MSAAFDAWIDHELADRLPAFLRNQRWFGSKAKPIRDVRCEDAVAIAAAADPLSLVLIRVTYDDGTCDRYGLLIAAVADAATLPVIGRIDDSLVAAEASTHRASMAALLSTLGAVAEHQARRGGRLVRHDSSEQTAASLAGLATRDACLPLGAEQSNTSIRVDRRYVFKLIRKLEDGENLELEIGRFLARRDFDGAPHLRAAWTWTDAGRSSTLGLLQDWVENQGDGWRGVIEQLESANGTASRELIADLHALGATTAALHVALGSDPHDAAFRAEPLTNDRVEAWVRALGVAIDRVCGLLTRLSARNDEARVLSQTVVDHAGGLKARRPPPIEGAGGASFDTIRIHGDYHLGQTLKTRDGFVIIDFEGEPARPLAERRRPQAAMKDVSGMLRSFDYAVETVRRGGSSLVAGDPLPDMRAAFLDAYVEHATAARASFLPRDRSVFDAWVSFFELDKAVYEIEYELNHRPDWAPIPLRGVLRLLGVPSG